MRAFRSIHNPEKRTFLLTLLLTGARVSELLDLRVKDVDFTDGCLVLETLKQRGDFLPRALPLQPKLLRELKKIIEKKHLAGEDHIWSFCRETGWRWVKTNLNAVGISGVKASPRGMRHGFGVACALSGIPLTTIQIWMGHKRLETTQIYLEVMGEEALTLIRQTWPT